MIATKAKFSPSANIQRDLGAPLSYYATPNAKQVYVQLLSEFESGNRAFNIIGAYGTGKSSFLLAFYQTLSGKYNYFPDAKKHSAGFGAIEFIELIGDYSSITSAFATRFDIKENASFKISTLLSEIATRCKANRKKNCNTIIAIDEFGKFLEYAAKHNPEQELYFIQQLAELANDEKNNLLLITTLHQDFGTYAFDLTKTQRNEWSKVKGRLKDITFNEPVEQLLYLASERMQLGKTNATDKDFHKLFNAISDAKAFPLRDYFNESVSQKLLPFDILSAAILTLSLQRYGQNERSLFSFLESNDLYGINDFNSTDEPYYNLACVYDYFAHNYYSFINSKSNPNYMQWNLLRKSIERIEGIDALKEKQRADAIKLIKTIGLLNIFATASAKLTKSFLCDYAKYALGVRNIDPIIETLEKNKVIRYVNYAFKYILFEGTDMDIDLAIDKAGNLVERVTNVVHQLQQNFEFPFLLAKREFFQKGTPRFFQFQISEQPISIVPQDEIDGYINLIFSNNLTPTDIKKFSETNNEAILFGHFKNTNEIQKLLFEIQKVNKVIELNPDDKVAIRELKGILQHNKNLLNHAVMNSLFNPDIVTWYFQGTKRSIINGTKLNIELSEICKSVYTGTPIFKNELINKTKISGQISTARRSLIDALLLQSDKLNVGLDETKFPPEKTIYLSLLLETGIHNDRDGFWQLSAPTDDSFAKLWEICTDFLSSAKTEKRSIGELAEILSQRPFKLKQGFLDYWLCIFLISQRDEFALYDEEGKYIPELSNEVLDLLIRKPQNFKVKTFNVAGIRLNLFKKYRVLINKSSQTKISNESFIETMKPFLVLYKNLNTYSKNTKNLPEKSRKLRDAIAGATDLEKTFFEEFPAAMGYTVAELQKNEALAEKFIKDLQESIKGLQSCYTELLNEFEASIKKTIGESNDFPAYQSAIIKRYTNLKSYLLLPEQKKFHGSICSVIDDRESYLSGIALRCIGKSLDTTNDEETKKLHARFSELILELDTLTEISDKDVDNDSEEVLMLQVSSFVKGMGKRIVRIPKAEQEQVNTAIQKIKPILRNDKKLNLSILVKLLQEELSNEK